MKFIADVVKKSNLFSEVGYTLSNEEKSTKLLSDEESDYTLNINIYSYGNEMLAALSGFVTGFTFGIVPGGATNHFVVEVKCYDKKNQEVAEYKNHDRIQFWIGIWFIPFMNNTPDKASKGTIENQIITSLIKMFEDDKLEYSFEDANRISLPKSSIHAYRADK